MGRVYAVTFEGQALTTANADHDYFELTPADDKPLQILGIDLSFYTEIGDAQEEIIRWGIVRGHTTTGNGTSATPNPLDPADAAAGFTAETVASTIASVGTTQTLHASAFNIRTGLLYMPIPEARIQATQANTTIVVRQFSTLTDDASASGTLLVEEL